MSGQKAISTDKVCEAIRHISKMEIWGSFTLCFEGGNVTKMIDNFIWTANEVEKGDNLTDPSEVLKRTLPSAISTKKLVVRTGRV